MKPLLVALLLTLAACSQYEAVERGQRKVGGMTLTAQAAIWNDVPPAFTPGGLPTWTVDGVTLNSLSFVSDIRDGQPLVEAEKSEKYPVFHADMLPDEIAELMQSTCAKLFQATITRTGELKPLIIAGQPGFELDFEFVTGDEVIRRAFIGGTVKDGRLQAVIYQAARMHYYAKDFTAARDLIVTAGLP